MVTKDVSKKSSSVLDHITTIKGLRETPQQIALRALRSITKSVASAELVEDIPIDLLCGETIDLHRWSMILKDTAMEQISHQAERRQTFYLDTTASTLPQMFRTFWTPYHSDLGLLRLDIGNSKEVTDWGVSVVARSSPNLRALLLGGCSQLTDVGLRDVAIHCPKLTELDISSCHLIAGDGLVAVAEGCKFISKLNLSRCNAIQLYSLQRLFRNVHHLEDLIISYSKVITDDELRVLAENSSDFMHLEAVECKNVSDQAILYIAAHCKDLDFVDLSRTEFTARITDMSLMALGQRCPSLRTLKMNHCDQLTDVGIGWLTDGCKVIETLELNGCNQLTDAGLRVLGHNCRALTYLDISLAKSISDIGLAKLSTGCQQLKTLKVGGIFFLSDPRIPPASSSSSGSASGKTKKTSGATKREAWEEQIGLNALTENCSVLESLDLTGCFRLNKALAQALPALSSTLRTLNLKGLNQCVPSSLLTVARNCSLLQELILSDTGRAVTNEVLTAFQQNALTLATLTLCRCQEFQTPGVQSISRMVALQKLDLSGCAQLTDGMLVPLSAIGTNPQLHTLEMTSMPRVTDSFVAWFAMKEHSLLQFAVRNTAVSAKSLQSVRDRFPHSELIMNSNFVGFAPKARVFDRMLVHKYQQVIAGITKTQSRIRKHMAAQRVNYIRQHRQLLAAHLLLHCIVRGFLARRRAHRLRKLRDLRNTSAVIITSIFRMILPKKKLKRLRYQRYVKMLNDNAQTIQRAFRCFAARKRLYAKQWQRRQLFLHKVQCAIKMQSLGRMYLAKLVSEHKRELRRGQQRTRVRKAIVLQRVWRGILARRLRAKFEAVLLAMKLRRQRAATVVQRNYRSHRTVSIVQERIDLKQRRYDCARRIQSLIRGALARLHVAELAMETITARRRQAALKIQCRYRVYRARCRFFQRVRERRRMRKKQNDSANIIIGAARMKLAWNRFLQKRREYVHRMQQEAQRVIDAATTIQALVRRYLGRIAFLNKLNEHKGKWKELFDEKKQKRFFYNKLTGEIRWRIPQDLLDLVPHPPCDNCSSIEAIIECKVCNELFCGECFHSVHAGGRRKDHEYRSIYDFYGKRIDYGDGIFPCQWPTEVIQDEIQGWMLRIAPHRTPHRIYAASGWEEYHFSEDEIDRPTSIFRKNLQQERVHNSIGKNYPRVFYFNRNTFQSTYDKPAEVAAEQYAESVKAQDLIVPRSADYNATTGGYYDYSQQQYYQQDYNHNNNNNSYYGDYGWAGQYDANAANGYLPPAPSTGDYYAAQPQAQGEAVDYSAYGYYDEEGNWVWYDTAQNNAQNFASTMQVPATPQSARAGVETPVGSSRAGSANIYGSQQSTITPRRGQRRVGYPTKQEQQKARSVLEELSEDSTSVTPLERRPAQTAPARSRARTVSFEEDHSSSYAMMRTTDVTPQQAAGYKASDGSVYNYANNEDDDDDASDIS